MRKLCLMMAAVFAICMLASFSYGEPAAKSGDLFNGKNLDGWKLRDPQGRRSWWALKGLLHNGTAPGKPGTDICTVGEFGDCVLHIEFRVPKDGNSGVYLQGIYEVQVADSFREPVSAGMCGAIYGKIVPSLNASRAAGKWQSYDITFRQARVNESGQVVEKARVTVVHNGKKIINNKEIDGVTGGALSDKEGKPGPLMLQGNHTSVDYRNIRIRSITAPGL